MPSLGDADAISSGAPAIVHGSSRAADASIDSVREIRAGAIALAAGCLLFVAGITVFLEVVIGAWDRSLGATLADTAAMMRERWSGLRAIWIAEMCAALLVAIAALALHGAR